MQKVSLDFIIQRLILWGHVGSFEVKFRPQANHEIKVNYTSKWRPWPNIIRIYKVRWGHEIENRFFMWINYYTCISQKPYQHEREIEPISVISYQSDSHDKISTHRISLSHFQKWNFWQIIFKQILQLLT